MKGHEPRVEERLTVIERKLLVNGFAGPSMSSEEIRKFVVLALAQLHYIEALESVAQIAGKAIPTLVSARRAVCEAMQRI
jgi:hypothetical protein